MDWNVILSLSQKVEIALSLPLKIQNECVSHHRPHVCSVHHALRTGKRTAFQLFFCENERHQTVFLIDLLCKCLKMFWAVRVNRKVVQFIRKLVKHFIHARRLKDTFFSGFLVDDFQMQFFRRYVFLF